jgi:predicted RNA-binding protein with PUA-like domain
MTMRYWLMKSEPETFSLDDLVACPKQTTAWDGVRNYQARNFMRDGMREGDKVLFYHSRTAPVGVVGCARISRAAYPDATQFDPKSTYFDPTAREDAPRWMVVDVTFESRFASPVLLHALRQMPELGDMMLLQKGSRLSVQPVTAAQYRTICRLGG